MIRMVVCSALGRMGKLCVERINSADDLELTAQVDIAGNGENHQTIEYKLTLDSNPQFAASMLVATARAAVKMHNRGERGCKTVLDIAPADLSSLSREEMLAHLL